MFYCEIRAFIAIIMLINYIVKNNEKILFYFYLLCVEKKDV